LNDCSALDHCNHWIFDAAIDLTKTSWGSSEVGGSSPKKVPGLIPGAASFQHSLLSIDVDVCVWMATHKYLILNDPQTKRDSGLFPMGSLQESANGSRMVTLSMMSCDPITS